MTTKITFIYDNLKDPADFEAENPDLMAMARVIPGFQGIETSQVRPRRTVVLRRRTG